MKTSEAKVKGLFIEHGLIPEISEYLEKIPTAATKEICGRYIVLNDIDMTELLNDINKIGSEVERIHRVTAKTNNPWIARDLLDGKAAYMGDMLVYMPLHKPKGLRDILEKLVGPMTDEQFKNILDDSTIDIKVNDIGFGRKTYIEELIKIAAQCLVNLNRCNGKSNKISN